MLTVRLMQNWIWIQHKSFMDIPCASVEGFQSGSYRMMRLAPVSFSKEKPLSEDADDESQMRAVMPFLHTSQVQSNTTGTSCAQQAKEGIVRIELVDETLSCAHIRVAVKTTELPAL